MDARWDTGRTEAFSDGVFAIAITLLVLDIGIPPGGYDHLWRAVLDEWPAYLGFATSFLTIGAIWLAHHDVFQRLRFANAAVMRVNLLLLMAVSFLPFPTRLVAEAIRNEEAERAAVVVYGIALLVISTLFSVLWGAVLRDRELLRPEVTEGDVRAITLATAPSIGFYAALIALAFLVPQIAALGFLVIAIVAVLRAQGEPSLDDSTGRPTTA